MNRTSFIDMYRNKQLDKIRGSLVGGAVGDALGYPVEFINSYEGIKNRYDITPREGTKASSAKGSHCKPA